MIDYILTTMVIKTVIKTLFFFCMSIKLSKDNFIEL